jgi:hypothetical protein
MMRRQPPLGARRDRVSERQVLDGLLADVRDGQSAVLVIRGEAGIGKTALLRYTAHEASRLRLAQIAGVETGMELPFAGVHQLCAPVDLEERRLRATSRAACTPNASALRLPIF